MAALVGFTHHLAINIKFACLGKWKTHFEYTRLPPGVPPRCTDRLREHFQDVITVFTKANVLNIHHLRNLTNPVNSYAVMFALSDPAHKILPLLIRISLNLENANSIEL